MEPEGKAMECRAGKTEEVAISHEELSYLRLMERTVEHMRGYVMIVEHTHADPPYLIRYVNDTFTRTHRLSGGRGVRQESDAAPRPE